MEQQNSAKPLAELCIASPARIEPAYKDISIVPKVYGVAATSEQTSL